MKLARYALMLLGAVALAGCHGPELEQIGPSKVVDLDGKEAMTMQAPADGQISVYNQSTENLIYSGLIHKGSVLVVDPVAKNVTIDGVVTNSKPLYGGDSLKIVFDENK